MLICLDSKSGSKFYLYLNKATEKSASVCFSRLVGQKRCVFGEKVV